MRGSIRVSRSTVKPRLQPTAIAESESTNPEQTHQANDDQVQRDDVIQQPWHNQNQNSRDKRNQRRQDEMHVHGNSTEESAMLRCKPSKICALPHTSTFATAQKFEPLRRTYDYDTLADVDHSRHGRCHRPHRRHGSPRARWHRPIYLARIRRCATWHLCHPQSPPERRLADLCPPLVAGRNYLVATKYIAYNAMYLRARGHFYSQPLQNTPVSDVDRITPAVALRTGSPKWSPVSCPA